MPKRYAPVSFTQMVTKTASKINGLNWSASIKAIKLSNEKISWIDEYKKVEIRETNDQLIRHIEELDTIRDKVILIQEELANSLSEGWENDETFFLKLCFAYFCSVEMRPESSSWIAHCKQKIQDDKLPGTQQPRTTITFLYS